MKPLLLTLLLCLPLIPAQATRRQRPTVYHFPNGQGYYFVRRKSGRWVMAYTHPPLSVMQARFKAGMAANRAEQYPRWKYVAKGKRP